MNLFEAFLPAPHAVLFLANLALAVLLSCAAALLAAFIWQRRPAPTRYGLLLLGLALVLASPALVWLAGRAGIGRLQVTLSEQRDSRDTPPVLPETSSPAGDGLGGPQVPESEPAHRSSGFTPERSASLPDTRMELPLSPSPEPKPEDVVKSPPPAQAVSWPWYWSVGKELALIWAAGTLVSLAWLLCGMVRLTAFCRGLSPAGWASVPTGSGRRPNLRGVQQAARQAATHVGLARPPRLFISAQIVTPLTFGLFRPAVVLPKDFAFADDLTPDQLHAVLVHEMAHVARRDPWIGLAQRLAAALYWWCPLVHGLNRRLADVREELCDNYVLRSQGDGANLAEALVALAERIAKPSPLPATVGMFEHRRARERSRALEQRIRRLLSTETNPMTRMNRIGSALVALLGLVMTTVVFMSHVRAGQEDVSTVESGAASSPTRPATRPDTGSNNNALAGNPSEPPNPAEAGMEPEKLIAEIENLGGWALRDENRPDQPVVTVTLDGNKVTDALIERLEVIESLETLILGATPVTQTGTVHLKGLRRLRQLFVSRAPVSNAFLDRLQDLPHLQELYLRDVQLADASLEHLTGLSRLEGLSLDGNPVTDNGLKHLAVLPQLASLDLKNTFVTDSGVAELLRLPRLKYLDLMGTKLAGVGIEQLAELSELRYLRLQQTQITDASLERIRKLTQLTGIDLRMTGITDNGLEHLSGWSQLTSLNIAATNVTDAGLVHLRGMTQLQTLNLGSRISDAGLGHLSGLTQMRHLNLARTKVTDDGLAHLREMTQLRWLDLTHTKVTEAGLKHLRGLTKLERLGLPTMPLSDSGLAHLRGLSQLDSLDVRGAGVTDQGLQHLRGLSQLRMLDLSDTPVTDAGLEHLGGLAKLNRLILANTKVTDAGLGHLRGLTQLGVLDLSGTQIADAGLVHL